MIANSQKEAMSTLNILAKANRQSILIVGPAGSGKSYLARRYADMLNIDDFNSVDPKVTDIKEALDACQTITNPVMLEIHNLDLGVASAAYALLKSLEEPLPHVYLVITCRNAQNVPDTIISRSAVLNVSPPTNDDIDLYGHEKNALRFSNVASRLVWQCVRSFSDADSVLEMSPEEIEYYEQLSEICKFNDSVSNIVWRIGHYNSNKECNVELAIRSIMELMKNPFVTLCGIECITDLNKSRIAQHAVLSKFVFNAKYCE